MAIRRFALAAGVIYLLVGIAGFIPQLLATPPGAVPPVSVTAFYGYLLNLFPVNALHSIVHLVVGIGGLLCAASTTKAIGYARALAVVYAVLTVMGLIPRLDTVFGLIPLHGHDVWLHALTAAIAAYFGFVASPAERGMGSTTKPQSAQGKS